LKPLVIAIRDAKPMYACLVVARGSPVKTLGDLRGKSLAMPRQSREHCRLFLERRCQPSGKEPQQFFSKVTTPREPEDALDDVVDGVVDAALVDDGALQRYKKDKAARSERLRVAVCSEPFPNLVVAYKPGVLSDETLQRLQDGFLTANENSKGKILLNMCRIARFEAVPRDYEKLLANIAKAYPPPPDAEK
jgi:ABC-type phosphate/phosphonate transport system substrate-binding protein